MCIVDSDRKCLEVGDLCASDLLKVLVNYTKKNNNEIATGFTVLRKKEKKTKSHFHSASKNNKQTAVVFTSSRTFRCSNANYLHVNIIGPAKNRLT